MYLLFSTKNKLVPQTKNHNYSTIKMKISKMKINIDAMKRQNQVMLP